MKYDLFPVTEVLISGCDHANRMVVKIRCDEQDSALINRVPARAKSL